MAKTNDKGTDDTTASNGDSNSSNSPAVKAPEEITLVIFCDRFGVNKVDRNAVYLQYGKSSKNTTDAWMSLLSNKINITING